MSWSCCNQALQSSFSAFGQGWGLMLLIQMQYKSSSLSRKLCINYSD
jgi:hypothetical protein